MGYEFSIKTKIKELEEMNQELSTMYSFYLKKHDYASLDNITRQLYRNKYAIDILKDL